MSTAGTALNALSIDELNSLPARLDDRQLRLVHEMSQLPVPAPERCDDEFFARCFRAIAILPRQASDDTKGELQVKLYQRKLGNLPKPQISFLVDRALERCKWFPTIAECLAIAGEWGGVRADEARRLAHQRYHGEMDARTKELAGWKRRIEAGLVDQDDIDAMPGWMTKALLRSELLVEDEGQIRVARPRAVAEFPYWLPGLEALALAQKYGAPTELPNPETNTEGTDHV